jgi:hypothetical protein
MKLLPAKSKKHIDNASKMVVSRPFSVNNSFFNHLHLMTQLVRILTIACAMVFCFSPLSAQTYEINDVEYFARRSIKPIKKGRETVGYVILYKTDKADRKNDNFAFELLDEQLKKVNRVKVVLPRKSVLVQSAYNGETLGLMFFDPVKKTYLFKAYDATLKLVGSTTGGELNKYEVAAYSQMTAEEVGAYFGIYAVPGKGFVRSGFGEDKDKFSVICYDSNFKRKWRYTTPESQKGYETFFPSDINDKYVTGFIVRRKTLMSRKFEYYLGVFDIETGKKLVDVSLEDEGDNLSINATNLSDNDEVIVQGEFYDAEDKAGVTRSNGIYFKLVDIKTGKITKENNLGWEKSLYSLFDAKGKASIEDNYANYPMTMIKAPNGHRYIVFEQYKKAADAVGIAVNVLGGQASNVKIVVGNLWLLEIDEQFKPVAVKYYEKERTSVGLPPGAGVYGTGFLGMFVKNIGGFDYQFHQQSADFSTFNIAYLNYDREKGEKPKVLVGNIFLAKDGSFNFDEVDITSKKKVYRYLYPAPNSQLMVVEHDVKAESLTFKLVKLNY